MTGTPHRNCSRVFGRLDPDCPRCQELAAGAVRREQPWRGLRARQEQSRARALEAHFAPGGPHARGDCGPVCTCGDW